MWQKTEKSSARVEYVTGCRDRRKTKKKSEKKMSDFVRKRESSRVSFEEYTESSKRRVQEFGTTGVTRELEESATGFRRVYLEWKERDIQA